MAPSPRRASPRRTRRQSNQYRSPSNGALLPRPSRRDDIPEARPKRSNRDPQPRSETSKTTTQTLSEGSLAKLDALNEKLGWSEYDNVQARAREKMEERPGNVEKQRTYKVEKRDHRRQREHHDHNHDREREKRRVVSGPLLEEGRHEDHRQRPRKRGGAVSQDIEDWERRRRKRKRLWTAFGVIALILIIAIPVGVSVSRKNNTNSSTTTTGGTPTTDSPPSNSNLNSTSESSIPAAAQGTYLDPFTWYDTTDFNVTYTNVTVGGLPIMGLNSTWDDSIRANGAVPPLTESWQYGTVPIRGMNLGGWLSIEPFITPSLFSSYSSSDGIIDEWTLCTTLGEANAKSTLEKHYSSFVSEQTFADIQAAGFDHVRIPYSYWAVTTYDGDPYVPQVSWRYLLRAIEWARKHGLRINLDLHALPGSQNGWNHSGHQGVVGWLNGTDGELNAERSLDIHRQLSAFFAQSRYNNVVTMYGLVNEPKMTAINTASVIEWTESAITIVRASGMPASTIIVFSDGFFGLANWAGRLTGYANLLLDAHQYVIFNNDQIVLDHTAKINFACEGWTQQTQQSMSAATGAGSFLCGEWSQADTDCIPYLNDVGVGSRWEGTLDTGNATTSVLTPQCPTGNSPRCDCSGANADPSSYSEEYKTWLLMFAEAQMHSFELGWGWFYWTWQTESAVQWSWKAGVQAGTLPQDARVRAFDCASAAPDFAGEGLSETY